MRRDSALRRVKHSVSAFMNQSQTHEFMLKQENKNELLTHIKEILPIFVSLASNIDKDNVGESKQDINRILKECSKIKNGLSDK